ncbi:MAG: DNA alkylation repair protein, partial [Chloroflexota bacterium]|nr:DNA alkylation repair protein [Chloroflexota bacterium]
MTTPTVARSYFRKWFTAAGTPLRAAHDRAYLRSDLRFYGATVPEIRRASAAFARAHPDLTRAELRAIVAALYASGWNEERSAAIALLAHYTAVLRESDLPWLAKLA